MSRRKTLHNILFLLLITGIACGLVGYGFWIGYEKATRPFRLTIQKYHSNASLGGLADEKAKPSIARAYLDPRAAQREMDGYSWSPPETVSPFVGYGCEPGDHDNAHINALQMRADREPAMPKPPDRLRIFLTGGSTAYCSGAPSQDRTIGGYLESLLNRTLPRDGIAACEVFTVATPAWSSTHERIVTENRLSEREPDLVASLSGNNDAHWGMARKNVLWFRTYGDDYFLSLVNLAHAQSGFAEPTDVAPDESAPVPPDVVAQRLEKNVSLASAALAMRGAPYVYFLQPTLAVSRKGLTPWERSRLHDREYFRQCYERIRARLSQARLDDFQFFDLSGMFDELKEGDAIFVDSYHFGDKGNSMIADRMGRDLEEIVRVAIARRHAREPASSAPASQPAGDSR